ncbi:YbaB/EbfC family DNA-binding protein [Cellulomonas triticagri]|uniref:YbaB/EbfC family DNA-binding protein n=1 Tax=Cellulomonas triticagri TaxID=2483352 RepID=A0A3M2ISW6_9CELL|nr:YbaB/EbfC family DNA-binding protein [Cellulomonas triticagri]
MTAARRGGRVVVLGTTAGGVGRAVTVRHVTGFFDDPDAALQRVQDDIRAAQQRAEQAADFKDTVDAIRGRARSPRGEVTVEVDTAGQLVDLRLADDATEIVARDLSAMILTTVRAAATDAARQALAATAQAFGEQSPVTAQMRAELAPRLG